MSESSNQNPYQSPAVEPIRQIKTNPKRAESIRRTKIWLVGFVLNLPVPALAGLGFASGTGIVGMICSVVVIAVIGMAACFRWPKFATVLTIGTYATAFSQLVPVLQLFAGLIAIECADGLRPLPVSGNDGAFRFDLDTLTGGFLVTSVTAAILVVAALAIGICLRFAYLKLNEWRSKGASPGSR